MSQTSQNLESVHWVVGVDLRAHSHGAINFARWLREHDRTGSMVIDGLHVIESGLFELPGAPPHVELLESARKATFAALRTREADAVFSSVDVVEADDATDTLAAAGRLATTTGIIVGRRAGAEHTGIRLGKVGRRLLRRLDAPTFVVPPDLEHDKIGAGPIVCAVTLDDDGIAVARFGERLGEALGRRVRLVHVISRDADPIGVAYLPPDAWDDLHRRQREAGHAALELWHEASGLSSHTMLKQGQTVPELLAAARELDACMILCGSRRLSLAERVWSSSIGSTLAASAWLPVAVLPSSQS